MQRDGGIENRRGSPGLARFALALALLGVSVSRARAEGTQPAALYAIAPSEARADAATAKLVERLVRRAGQPLLDAREAPEDGRENESPASQLSVLQQAERALIEARELSTQLREADALRVLGSAEQALLGALALPGVHAFLAEVYVQLALCAAQLDQDGLLETALRRGLSLDPDRRIEAAEAPPSVLQRARALSRMHDLAPISEGRIEGVPSGANAWLDGVRLSSELAFRARVGVHVLVVRAPGHAPYATLLSLAPGKRPALRIALSVLPREAARRALLAAEGAAQRERRARELARARASDVYLVEVGSAPYVRALVQRCSERDCARAAGVAVDGRDHDAFEDAESAAAWLRATPLAQHKTPPKTSDKPLWKRWPLWTGSALLLVAGTATAVWATRDPHRHQQRSLEIDASALPR